MPNAKRLVLHMRHVLRQNVGSVLHSALGIQHFSP